MSKTIPAGQELDALIAEKVFGRRSISRTVSVRSHFGNLDKTVTYLENGREVPPYSTDIAAAWLVVEKLENQGWHLILNNLGQPHSGKWSAQFTDVFGRVQVYGEAETSPHAICLAALKTIKSIGGK